jgi:hypothetical protein
MPRRPNDVGVAWKKTNDLGEYVSIALDLDVLLELTGGVVEKCSLNMYPIVSDNPKAPDFQLKFYPPKGTRPASPAPRTTPVNEPPLPGDDDIPF